MEIAIPTDPTDNSVSRPSVQGRVSGCALLRSVHSRLDILDLLWPQDTSLIPVWYQLTRYQWYLYQWIPRVCIETALALGLSNSGTTWVSGASWLCSAAGFSVGWDRVARLQIFRFSDRVRGVQASARTQKNQKTRLKWSEMCLECVFEWSFICVLF